MTKEKYITEEISKIEERKNKLMLDSTEDSDIIKFKNFLNDVFDNQIEKIKNLSDEDYESKLEFDEIVKNFGLSQFNEQDDYLPNDENDEETRELYYKYFPKSK